MSARRRALAVAAAALAAATAVAPLTAPAHAASGKRDLRGLVTGHRYEKPSLSADRVAELSQQVVALRGHKPQSYLLRLSTTATGATFASVKRERGTANARTAAKRQLGVVRSAQQRTVDALPRGAKVLFRTHAAMAAVAVRADTSQLTELSQLPGVSAVYPIAPKTRDNSYAVPFQNAPAAWAGDAGGQYLGQGILVADIDTGFDYTHADFGGPGTTEAYAAARAADDVAPAEGSYDPAKFDAAVSYDLAGDTYNADHTSPDYQPVPHPDVNPLDCMTGDGDGHGSHTAGTIAGYGVTAGGDTYAGPYDSAHVSTDHAADFKIGPGMAPKAKVMALRVFGCGGTTDVVSDAIERALDPNQDGDTSDHVQVINMSLGSSFGTPDDGDSVMANAAADLGVTLAISMGNEGDTYDVGGSPGAATKTITVASSVDAQSIVDGLEVSVDGTAQGPYAAERSVLYGDWSTKPDLTGTVAAPATNTTGCDPFTGADASTIAGKVALLTWTDDALECGSAARGANVRAAGGIGFVFASNLKTFSAGISGDTDIPGVLVASAGGQAIRSAVAQGKTVTITGTERSSVIQNFEEDNDSLSGFTSRGLRGGGDLKPDVAAVGNSVYSVLPGSGDGGQNMSGTSMAAPMVAGLAALVRSKHTGWTAEQVKADIVNTADHDLYVGGSDAPGSGKYAPMRVGAGRIDAGQALVNDVLASVVDDPGAVSLSWGTLELPGTATVTKTKTVKLQNTGTEARTYNAWVSPTTTVPGTTVTVSPTTVSVPAGKMVTARVTVSANPNTWQKTFDHTKGDYVGPSDDAGALSLDPITGLPNGTIAEASGNVVFTPTGASASQPKLRVPFYAAPKAVSTMATAGNLSLSTGGAGALALTGGSVVATNVATVVSQVEGFALTATSPVQHACTPDDLDNNVPCLSNAADRGSDIKYVGVTSTAPATGADPATGIFADNGVPTLQIGIVTQGAHTTAGDKNRFEVYLDTTGDGVPDLVTVNTHLDEDDVLVSATFDLRTGDNVDVEILNNYLGEVDTAAYDSDVVTLPIDVAALKAYGVSAAHPYVGYAIDAYGTQGNLVDSLGWTGAQQVTPGLKANVLNPGLEVTDVDGWSMAFDVPTAQAPYVTDLAVQRNLASYQAEGGRGLLLVHYHNAVGKKAQVVALKAAARPVLSLSPGRTSYGGTVTATATVPTVATDSGSAAATGTVTFKAGTRVLGTAPVASGRATLRFAARTPGRTGITATYNGDAGYVASASAAAGLTVTAISTPQVTLSMKTVKKGRKVTVTVTVPTVGGVTPTGTVALKVNGRRVSAKSLSRGKVAFSYKAKKKGKLKVAASYAGNGTYLAATSSKATFKVK